MRFILSSYELSLEFKLKLKYAFVVRKVIFFVLLSFCFPLYFLCEEWYELEVKILTTGENQPQKEVGFFGGEIPANGKGVLKRKLVVKNHTRGKENEIDFFVTFEPSSDESGNLHLLVTSSSKPKVGKEDNRFRDLKFVNPTSQIVEVYSDMETKTHLLLAISIKSKDIEKENLKDLKVTFKCKSTKTFEKATEEIDSYDLYTIGDEAAERRVTKNMPVVVKGDYGEVPLSKFKEIDSSKDTAQIKAGEGFTYTPSKKEKKRIKKDSRLPSSYFEKKEKEKDIPIKKNEEEATSVDYKKEDFYYSIKVIEVNKGKIKVVVSLSGTLFDPKNQDMKILTPKEETKIFSSGEIGDFTLYDEDGNGYLLKIQPLF